MNTYDSPLNQHLPDFDFWNLPMITAHALCNDPEPLAAYQEYVLKAHVPPEAKTAHLNAFHKHRHEHITETKENAHV